MTSESTSVVALREAVVALSSQAKLARLIGVTQQAVSRWLSEGKVLPGEHVLKVEAETGISRHALRPDLYPDESGHDATPADDRRRTADPASFGDMEPAR